MSRARANLSLWGLLLAVAGCKGSVTKVFEVAGTAPSFAGLVETQACVVTATDVGAVTCLDTAGATVWHADVCRPLRQRPAVIGGSLWIACEDGEWTALDERTGRARWKLTGKGLPASSLVSDRLRGAIPFADGTFDVVDETGARLWSGRGGPRLWAGGGAIAAAGDAGVTVFQAETGDPMWSADKAVLALTGNDELVVVARASGDLVAYDLPSGQQRWGVTLGAFAPDTLSIEGDALTVGLQRGDVVTLATLDGAERSRTTLPGPLAAPVNHGVAVAQGRDGCAYLLGSPASVCVDHQLRGSAVVRDGVLLLGPRDGRVLGFKLAGR